MLYPEHSCLSGVLVRSCGVSVDDTPHLSKTLTFQAFFDHYRCICRYVGVLFRVRSFIGALYWQAVEYQLSFSPPRLASRGYLIDLGPPVYLAMKMRCRIIGDPYLPLPPHLQSYNSRHLDTASRCISSHCWRIRQSQIMLLACRPTTPVFGH